MPKNKFIANDVGVTVLGDPQLRRKYGRRK